VAKTLYVVSPEIFGSIHEHRRISKMKKLTIVTTITLAILLLLLMPLTPAFAATSSVDRQVSSPSDDCITYWNGASWQFLYTGAVYHPQVGYGGPTYQKMQSGMRFVDIAIPREAVITAAYLSLCANSTDPSPNVSTTIRGEYTSSTTTFTDYANFQSRSRTTASVEWPVEAWTKDTWYESPSIKAVVQEIVNRVDWSRGDDITIFWGSPNAVSGTRRAAYSYDQDAGRSAQLHIEFTSSGYTSSDGELDELVDEFRELIVELRTQVGDTGYQNQTNELRLLLAGLDAQIKGLNNSTKELRDSASNLGSSIIPLRNDIGATGNKVDAMSKKVDTTGSKVDAISGELGTMSKTITGTLETKVSATERTAALEKRLTEIEEPESKPDGRIAVMFGLCIATFLLLVVIAIGTAMRR